MRGIEVGLRPNPGATLSPAVETEVRPFSAESETPERRAPPDSPSVAWGSPPLRLNFDSANHDNSGLVSVPRSLAATPRQNSGRLESPLHSQRSLSRSTLLSSPGFGGDDDPLLRTVIITDGTTSGSGGGASANGYTHSTSASHASHGGQRSSSNAGLHSLTSQSNNQSNSQSSGSNVLPDGRILVAPRTNNNRRASGDQQLPPLNGAQKTGSQTDADLLLPLDASVLNPKSTASAQDQLSGAGVYRVGRNSNPSIVATAAASAISTSSSSSSASSSFNHRNSSKGGRSSFKMMSAMRSALSRMKLWPHGAPGPDDAEQTANGSLPPTSNSVPPPSRVVTAHPNLKYVNAGHPNLPPTSSSIEKLPTSAKYRPSSSDANGTAAPLSSRLPARPTPPIPTLLSAGPDRIRLTWPDPHDSVAGRSTDIAEVVSAYNIQYQIEGRHTERWVSVQDNLRKCEYIHSFDIETGQPLHPGLCIRYRLRMLVDSGWTDWGEPSGWFATSTPGTGAERGGEFDKGWYVGTWWKGKPHGFGHWKHPTLGTYVGQYANGFPHGDGEWVGPTHEVYRGQLRYGKRNGHGRYVYANGFIYEGEWKYGLRHGNGLWQFPNREYYRGQFAQDQPCGQGVHYWPDGSHYHGEWKGGRMSGVGSYFFANSTVYYGEFLDGKPVRGRGKKYASVAEYEADTGKSALVNHALPGARGAASGSVSSLGGFGGVSTSSLASLANIDQSSHANLKDRSRMAPSSIETNSTHSSTGVVNGPSSRRKVGPKIPALDVLPPTPLNATSLSNGGSNSAAPSTDKPAAISTRRGSSSSTSGPMATMAPATLSSSSNASSASSTASSPSSSAVSTSRSGDDGGSGSALMSARAALRASSGLPPLPPTPSSGNSLQQTPASIFGAANEKSSGSSHGESGSGSLPPAPLIRSDSTDSTGSTDAFLSRKELIQEMKSALEERLMAASNATEKFEILKEHKKALLRRLVEQKRARVRNSDEAGGGSSPSLFGSVSKLPEFDLPSAPNDEPETASSSTGDTSAVPRPTPLVDSRRNSSTSTDSSSSLVSTSSSTSSVKINMNSPAFSAALHRESDRTKPAASTQNPVHTPAVAHVSLAELTRSTSGSSLLPPAPAVSTSIGVTHSSQSSGSTATHAKSAQSGRSSPHSGSPRSRSPTPASSSHPAGLTLSSLSSSSNSGSAAASAVPSARSRSRSPSVTGLASNSTTPRMPNGGGATTVPSMNPFAETEPVRATSIPTARKRSDGAVHSLASITALADKASASSSGAASSSSSNATTAPSPRTLRSLLSPRSSASDKYVVPKASARGTQSNPAAGAPTTTTTAASVKYAAPKVSKSALFSSAIQNPPTMSGDYSSDDEDVSFSSGISLASAAIIQPPRRPSIPSAPPVTVNVIPRKSSIDTSADAGAPHQQHLPRLVGAGSGSHINSVPDAVAVSLPVLDSSEKSAKHAMLRARLSRRQQSGSRVEHSSPVPV